MHLPSFKFSSKVSHAKRTTLAQATRLCAAAALGLGMLTPTLVHAATSMKFQLDWRFEGPPPSSCIPPPRAISTRPGWT